MKTNHNPELIQAIFTVLKEKAGQDCINFLLAYGNLVEMVDDYYDQDKGEVKLEDISARYVDICSSKYWQANCPQLWMVEKLNHLTFQDVLKWEKSTEEWKRRDAKSLSHCAYNMLFAVMIIEIGLEEACKYSEPFRTSCHELHLGDKI